MKIYTKKGDKGITSLLGGTKVPKYHERIEAYGTIDELNSFIGLLRDSLQNDHIIKILFEIQNSLFVIGSHLAADEKSKFALPTFNASLITTLETEMDGMDQELPPLKNFILPGGHVYISYCHIIRTVCRRAERRVIELNGAQKINPQFIQFLNRLSDYFFVLARKLAHDLKITLPEWKPETTKG